MIKNKSYNRLCSMDATGMLKYALGHGLLKSTDDGRFMPDVKLGDVSTWLFIKTLESSRCFIWHRVYFQHCNFIPEPCHSCYKIVVRPANLKAACDFYDIMQDLDLPSKIGWEARPTVFGTFGAYFYNRSVEDAKYKLPLIQEAAEKIELLVSPFTGEKIEPIIKKGCTEFEHKFGPSDKWKITEEQKIKERLLNSLITVNHKNFPQSDHRAATVLRLWIHNAFMVGDSTVSEFLDGPLYPPYVTY